jgi:cytochrome c556
MLPGPVAAEPVIKLASPPASLEQWYKPANKRQVWLHTMFRLRREMQAIEEYSEQQNPAELKKWIKRLDKDYNKIAEMIPEWEKEIKPRLIPELETFTKTGDYLRIKKTLKMISRTCKDCHQAYAPVVTAMYRSPGYDNIKVRLTDGSTQSFDDNMKVLSKSLNRVLIALKDGHKKTAMQARNDLVKDLTTLETSCNSCHKDDSYPVERILGKATKQKLDSLEKNIRQWKVKPSQELMGKLAVTVCARCHNTHRITADLRGALLK